MQKTAVRRLGAPEVERLWDELSEFGPAEAGKALDLLMARTCAAIGAQQAFWMGTVRLSASGDPLGGWRPAVIHYMNSMAALQSNFTKQTRDIEGGGTDPTIIENLRDAGKFRVRTQHEIAPPGWFESEYYRKFLAPFNIHDVIYVTMPVGPDAESWLGFQRIGRQRIFGAAEIEFVERLIRPMRWFHLQVALHFGLHVANTPLTKSERKVLEGLLGAYGEKEIASRLGFTPATVHTYATRIYRKFNVRGRTGLTALWMYR